MRIFKFSDLDLLEVGHEIQLYGAIYTGRGFMYMIPMPDEDADEVGSLDAPGWVGCLAMTADELEKFFKQTDVLDVRGPDKIVIRKSQRQVDAAISWRVFRRDGYSCRYCGRNDVPLSVDHIDLWEDGGVTVEANLNASCRRCNKLRGRVPYEKWVESSDYRKVSHSLSPEARGLNSAAAAPEAMERLRSLRTSKQRSR